MKSKKIQHILFISLFILSVSSSLYLNLHVEPNQNTISALQETSEQEGTELMADIDAFKDFFHKIARQVALH